MAEAADEEEALAHLALSPDVVVLDATLAVGEVVRTIERIVERAGSRRRLHRHIHRGAVCG